MTTDARFIAVYDQDLLREKRLSSQSSLAHPLCDVVRWPHAP